MVHGSIGGESGWWGEGTRVGLGEWLKEAEEGGGGGCGGGGEGGGGWGERGAAQGHGPVESMWEVRG